MRGWMNAVGDVPACAMFRIRFASRVLYIYALQLPSFCCAILAPNQHQTNLCSPRPFLQTRIATMAHLVSRAAQGGEELSTAVLTLIISAVVLLVIGIFCAVLFCLVIRKQRATKKRHQAMQDGTGRTPYAHLLPVPDPYPYNGPLELQGSIQPAPVQQLDSYVVAVGVSYDEESGLERELIFE